MPYLRGICTPPVHFDAPICPNTPILSAWMLLQKNIISLYIVIQVYQFLTGNTTYQAKHIPDACEHSGKNHCCNMTSMGYTYFYTHSTLVM